MARIGWEGTSVSGRRARLEDVAVEVGLSPATVSLVLRNIPGPSEATRQRVLAAADRLGYRPDRAASLLARHRAHLLGVTLQVGNSYHAELAEDLLNAAEDVGYDIVLSAVTRRRVEARAVETLIDSRCEGLILLGPEAPVTQLAALAKQMPVVVVGRRLSAPGIDIVRSADDKGVALAVGHLVELGHHSIGFVDGGKGTIASDRRRGFLLAMGRRGLSASAQVLPGDQTEEAGIRAGRRLAADPDRPTAVITFNDRGALGLLDALSRAGIEVPGRMSVVGYDDSPASQLSHINLTTVSQEARAQAENAVTASVERLDGGRTQRRQVVLAPRLVVRATTGPPCR
jgi:DNA-binding LacI/PurR family transcriptional regulator